MFAQLSICDDDSLLVELKIKLAQWDDKENFNFDVNNCIRFHNQICVPYNAKLKRLILREAQDGSFTMHLCNTFYPTRITDYKYWILQHILNNLRTILFQHTSCYFI